VKDVHPVGISALRRCSNLHVLWLCIYVGYFRSILPTTTPK